MIIVINGPYAVGKTTVAQHLTTRLSGSMLFDPELIGYCVRDLVSQVQQSNDYQELTPWVPLVLAAAKELQIAYNRDLIIPVGIWQYPQFDLIMNGLRQIDAQTFHFCLTARRETIIRRLLNRGDRGFAYKWMIQRLDKTLATYQSPNFSIHLPTDNSNPNEIADQILMYKREFLNISSVAL